MSASSSHRHYSPSHDQAHPPHPHRTPYRNSAVHLMTVLTPLVIGELIKDPEKRWRWIRGSVVTALAGEMLWQHRIAKEREREEEEHGADR